MQSAVESLYGLIDSVLVGPIIGHNGKPYIPFVFTIFMLVFTMNFLGVVLSSSDTQDLHAMCTRILVLRDGVIVRELRGDVSEAVLHHTIEGTDEGAK